ncbi:hypothetical protein F4677DRAFT_11661 [Hypoxylon crocopeplum]|nr:hypothetical protein F4677DRAFT_11661 [Hypoxylon crocopeplum]
MAAYPHMDPAYFAGGHQGILQGAHALEDPISSHQVDQGGIPLICHACPNTPRFSDLSHLLTHVSSKGHLSQVYELRIASKRDPAAATRYRKFDMWSETYNIDELVLQRRETRGDKGDQSRRQSLFPRDAPLGQVTMRRGSRSSRGGRGSRSNTVSHSHNRNPHGLADFKFDTEEDVNFGDGYDDLEGSIQPWRNNLDALMPHGGDLDAGSHTGFEGLRGEALSKSASPESGSPFSLENVTETTETNEASTGPHSLKGTIYPGMSLFDAAREEQRRKRNQRKHPAVLEQLEINSRLVTTDEDVLDCNLDYQRTRDVYDEPSIDGSEDEDQKDQADKKRQPRKNQSRKPRQTIHANPVEIRSAAYDSRATSHTPAQMMAIAQHSMRTVGGRLPVPSRVLKSTEAQPAVNRGSVSQAQLPLHNHGFQGDAGLYRDVMGGGGDLGWDLSQTFAGEIPANSEFQTLLGALAEGGDGSEFLQMTDSSMHLGLTFFDSPDRLPGLALRPGDPNLSFVLPGSSTRQSPSSLVPGKENDGMPSRTASSSNPYLQPDSMQGENYNPLYVQPRDGLGFRMYAPPYEEDVKSSTSPFQPINGHGTLSAYQMPTHHNASYPPNQSGGDDFDV